jgi:uncharacterized membrane protein YcaP (DUF421 family)
MLTAFQSLDWHKMFFGDAPPAFLIEIAIRTCIIYAYSLLLIRWIGGRGIGQMSVVEFLLVVALGSAIGDAMFYPDVPLIHAMLVITLVVAINKLIDIGMCTSPRIRRVFSGSTVAVVEHGRINLDALRYLKVSREELFEGLREKGIRNLGRIEYAFLEAGGSFSVFKHKGSVVGLPILPQVSSSQNNKNADCLCAACAEHVLESTPICPRCGGNTFVVAAIDPDDEN